jgi:hypothetical protein
MSDSGMNRTAVRLLVLTRAAPLVTTEICKETWI